MRLLLDTQVLLWSLADTVLTLATRSAVADPENDVSVSVASAWEVEIKRALSKLAAPEDLEQEISRVGFTLLPINIRHAIAAGRLPRHHDDPFDRMLIAQAQVEDLMLVTADKRFSAYDVRLMAL